MLKFGNKEFRNLQEQVKKNMDDISFILQEEGVLNEFGIKVVGQEASVIDMPTVDDYKEDNPEWSYGDAFAIGTEEPYELYILTRANGTHPNDYWFNIGEFPAPGPQGPEGPQGEVGPQGPTGNPGANGISPQLGVGNVVVETLESDQDATVAITESGTQAYPIWNFNFGIPKGQDGSAITAVAWGEITGSLANQTDLLSALQAKANASALASYATQVYANNVASNATYEANVYTDSQLSDYAKLSASVNSFTGDLDVGGDLSLVGYIKQPVSGGYINVFELPSESGKLALVSEIPDLTGYATKIYANSVAAVQAGEALSLASSYTDSQISALSSIYASKSEIPSLSGYATESWVSSNFLSIGTPVGGSAVWGSISGTLSNQTDLMNKFSEYATVSALSSAISGVNSTISALDYLSVGALSSATVIPDITGLASEGYVNTQIANLSSVYASISALSDYATISAVSSAIGALDYASVGALSSETYIPRVGGDNDGTYWTAITLGDDTYDIPQGGSVAWGDITGRLDSQTDLQDALDNKVDKEVTVGDDSSIIDSSETMINLTVDGLDTRNEPVNSYLEVVKDTVSTQVLNGIGEATQLIVSDGSVTVARDSDSASIDLFDLASMSYVDASISALSSVYAPAGSYASQADIDALSSVYASQSALSSYAELSGGNVLFHQIFTGYNQFNAPTSFYSSVTFKNVQIGGPWGGSLFTIDSGVSTSFYGHVRFSSNATFMKSVAFGGGAIYNGSTINSGFKLDLPSQSGSLALISDIDALSSVYAPLSDYASTSYVDSSISALSSVYAPVGGYAELSASNTFTAENTFNSQIKTTYIIPTTSNVYAIGADLNRYNSAYFNNIDIASRINVASVSYASEVWTFTLSDNTTVSKTILVG